MERAYRFVEMPMCNMCGSRESRMLGRRLDKHQGPRPTSQRGVTVSIVRCRDCGLIYPDPLPLPLNIGQHYDIEPSEYWTSEISRDATEHFDYEIARFRSLWRGTDEHPRALDIGAGLGKAMKALGDAGFKVMGIEPSSTFHSRAVASGISSEQLQLASIEDAALPRYAFDFVNFSAVLEHLYDPAGAIEQALIWTSQGGLIHFEVPSARWLTSRLAHLFYRLQGLDYVPFVSPMHPPYHLYEFTLEAFVAHGRRAGYFIRDHRVHVSSPYLPRPLANAAKLYMQRTGTGMQLEVWLERDSSSR